MPRDKEQRRDRTKLAITDWIALLAIFFAVLGTTWRLSIVLERRMTTIETILTVGVIPRLDSLESTQSITFMENQDEKHSARKPTAHP